MPALYALEGAGKGYEMPESTAQQEEQGSQQTSSTEKTFTQEEVNAIVQERVKRVKSQPPEDYEALKEIAAKYDRETENAAETITALNNELAALREKEERRETVARVASAVGVSPDIVAMLNGNDEDTLKKQAEKLKQPFAASVASEGGSPTATKTSARDEFAQFMDNII